MPRHPKPNYRADRRLWYVQVGGEQHTLARDDDHDSPEAAEQAARVAFYRLMAEQAEARRPGKCPTLGAVARKYFEDMVGRVERGEVKPRVMGDYWGRVEVFVAQHFTRPADQISADELDAYLASRDDWGMNRRVDFVTTLGTIYRWAKRRKLLSCDPPKADRPLPRKLKRDKIPDRAEMDAILGAIRSKPFLDFARFIALTGCRPSEAAAIEAAHESDGAVTLIEHKTRKKTGSARVIMLNAPAREIIARLSAAHPTGPVFRNTRGNPWNQNSWGQAFGHARTKAKADKRITLYSFRHGRATELLVATGDLPGVAAILGNDPTVTARTYSDVVNRRGHLKRLAEMEIEPLSPPPESRQAAPPPTPPPTAG